MTAISKDDVLAALRKVRGPDLKADVVTSGLVSDIVVAGKDVMFALTIDPARAEELEPMRKAAETAVGRIDGIGKVMVALTAEKKPGSGNGSDAAPAAAAPPPRRIAPPLAVANRPACRG